MIRAICRMRLVAGHHLRAPYEGKCARPHGHNYEIEATFEAPDTDNRGFAGIDFDEFKTWVKDSFDHQMLNECEPFDIVQPSAENLAKVIGTHFPWCVKVRVAETPDGIAEWVRDENQRDV